jgi:serine/threonine protein kinase
LNCCRPNPACINFCRLNGKLIAGQGVLQNPENGWEYEVLRTLVQGGSNTYLIYNYQINGLAVLKEIRAELVRKPKAREMFLREARILQSLEHPGIPKYYDFFWTNEYYSLVMEMIHGQNLQQISSTTPTEAIEWLLQVSQILDYLHKRNPPVIHRDIKPANLILRHHPRELVLIDFGAVKEATTPPETCIFTPGYGAPEQQEGLPCIQSDFYTLGTTLIYLLTKRSPTKFYLSRQGIFTGLKEAGIDPVVVSLILTLTERNPKNRPQNATEVIELLQNSLKALK